MVYRIADIFPNSTHVRDIGMKAANDSIVWEYAKANKFIIVSKDTDMHDLSLLFGSPPKVIWLRIGNCSTGQVEEVLRQNQDSIKLFYGNNSVSLLCLA